MNAWLQAIGQLPQARPAPRHFQPAGFDVWSEAIANLQRQRPEPLPDFVVPEDGDDEKMKFCPVCKKDKPMDDFQFCLRPDRPNNRWSAKCKLCLNAAAAANRRERNRKARES